MAGAPQLRLLVAVAATLAAVAWLIANYDMRAALAAVKSANVALLAVLLLVIVATFALRAWRWQVLLAESCEIRFAATFRALVLGYLVNSVAPAKAGEVARAYLLGRSEKVSRSTVFGTVVTERIADVAVLVLCVQAAAALVQGLPPWVRAGAWTGTAVALVGVVAILNAKALLALARRVVGPRVMASAFAQKADYILTNAAAGAFNAIRARALVRFVAVTAIIWALEVATAMIVAHAFHVTLKPAEGALLIFMLAIGTLVPAAVANIGPYEFFGVTALASVGVKGEHALALILVLHVAWLIGLGLLALLTVAVPLKPRVTTGGID